MKVVQTSVLVLAALVTGVLATKPVIGFMVDRAAIHNGPWRTNIGTGRSDGGLYVSAAVAVAGLYALAKEETIYFAAFTDSQGQKLTGGCQYLLTGSAPASRWWSLTMYGADHYLVANPGNIYSRHAGNLMFESDGSYRLQIAAEAMPGNWLPSPPKGAFSITLRLYNPAPTVYQNLSHIALPDIHRESCT